MKTNNLEIKKTYRVNGREFSTKEEALKTIASEELTKIVESGVQSVIDNSEDFVKYLRILNAGTRTVIKGGNGTLKGLQELMVQEGIIIERDAEKWPVYHLNFEDGSQKTIRYTGKVWELYNLFIEGGVSELLKHEVK